MQVENITPGMYLKSNKGTFLVDRLYKLCVMDGKLPTWQVMAFDLLVIGTGTFMRVTTEDLKNGLANRTIWEHTPATGLPRVPQGWVTKTRDFHYELVIKTFDEKQQPA